MTRWQFNLLLMIGIACVCLSFVVIAFAHENRKLQAQLQAQQVVVNKGALSQQIAANLLREMAAVAQTDEKMRQLLVDNGYNFSAQPSPSPSH